jgi:hypothetical protein
MRRRLLRPLLVLGLLAGLLPTAAPALQLQAAQAALANSANISHVLNLPQQRVEGAGNPSTGSQGSDIEFVDLDVTDLPGAPAGVSGLRQFALAGSLSNGMQIYDITDPQNTELASIYDCRVSQGDIQVFERDGRTYATYAADYGVQGNSTCYLDARSAGMTMGNNVGTFIVDLTNPYQPQTVSFINLSKGSHNQTVHPSGLWMYNSNNELTAGIGKVEVVDISDLRAPKQTKVLDLGTGIDSHDITFNAAGTRAYSAAVNHTLIINTTDPGNPSIVSRIIDTNSIHHQADPIEMDSPLGKRSYLVITDEVGGGSYGSTCPGGAIHIFDITGDLERTPVKVGVFEAPITRPAGPVSGSAMGCTSHVLRFYPEQKIMTIAWYNAGVHVVDVSSLIGVSAGANGTSVGAGMKELGYAYFDNSNTWSAKTNLIEEDGSFYLFANDISRGLDVFRYDATAPAATETGTWHTPAEFDALRADLTAADVAGALPYCILKGAQKQ